MSRPETKPGQYDAHGWPALPENLIEQQPPRPVEVKRDPLRVAPLLLGTAVWAAFVAVVAWAALKVGVQP